MLIQRREYLSKLIAFRDKQLIKIVTGIRRCGKSTLLEIYQDYLRENGVSETQIISINFEDMDYLEGIYNTIVVKDIVNRRKITDVMMLKSVLRFVFDNIGSPLSSKKIADTMT